MKKPNCKRCQYNTKSIGCFLLWRLRTMELGRRRFCGDLPFPDYALPKGACELIKEVYRRIKKESEKKCPRKSLR